MGNIEKHQLILRRELAREGITRESPVLSAAITSAIRLRHSERSILGVLQVNENKENWTKFVHNRELEMVDMNLVSNDSRTYIAIQSLFAAGGMFAYMAMTMGGSTTCRWGNACEQRM
jgi:uncharacterized membrane protein